MIEAINPIYTAALAAKSSGPTSLNGVPQTNQEFMTIFYKEILKQVMKPPNFSLTGEDEKAESRVFSTFNSDLIVEQLAKEFAKKNALNISNVMTGSKVNQ